HLSAGELAVTKVEGREGLSEPYAFAVDFVLRSGDGLDLDELLGREGELTLRRNTGEERVVHGECHRVELTGVAAGVPSYRVTLRPRLSRLALVTQSRIFQGKSVPQIVDAVLSRAHVAHRSALAGSYPALEYVAQYRESDLAFVSRLLEEEGIWYRFEHGPGSHELVLGDEPSGYAEHASDVPFRFKTGEADEAEHIHWLERECRDEPGEVELREYDFERPGLEVTSRAGDRKGPQVYEVVAGKYDGSSGKERAKRRLEGLRYGAETFQGKGNSLAFVPGAAIQLEERERILVVRMTHSATQELSSGGAGERSASYENAFEGIDAKRAYRPKRSTPQPKIRVFADSSGPERRGLMQEAAC
ncbi:MAG: type VI secretion system tip protein TssI/VgrG, partial [Anaeromyxobacteraceae bacterium]